MSKEIIYIDMDGVLVDLSKEIDQWFLDHPNLKSKYEFTPDHIPGIFRDPPPIDGSIDAINQLVKCGKYELIIATSAPWGNPSSSTDKRYWIEKHYGNLFHKQMVITHRKDLLFGDYLIDDRMANGADKFMGELLSFGWAYEKKMWNKYRNWEDILLKLL